MKPSRVEWIYENDEMEMHTNTSARFHTYLRSFYQLLSLGFMGIKDEKLRAMFWEAVYFSPTNQAAEIERVQAIWRFRHFLRNFESNELKSL